MSKRNGTSKQEGTVDNLTLRQTWRSRITVATPTAAIFAFAVVSAALIGGLAVGSLFLGVHTVVETKTETVTKEVEVLKDLDAESKALLDRVKNREPQQPSAERPLLALQGYIRSEFTTSTGERVRIDDDGDVYVSNIGCSKYGCSVYFRKGEMKALFTSWLVTLREQAAESVALMKQMETAAKTEKLSDLQADAVVLTLTRERDSEETNSK